MAWDGTVHDGGGDSRPTCSSVDLDPDEDGYGWEGAWPDGQTCLVRISTTGVRPESSGGTGNESSLPACSSADADPDGDGYGWEGVWPNGSSCVVSPTPDELTKPDNPAEPDGYVVFTLRFAAGSPICPANGPDSDDCIRVVRVAMTKAEKESAGIGESIGETAGAIGGGLVGGQLGYAGGMAVAGVAVALGVAPAVAAVGVVAAIGVVGYGMGKLGAWAGRGAGRIFDGRRDQTTDQGGPSTAQEAANTYSGGDLNGEFSGTSIGDGNGNPSGEGTDGGNDGSGLGPGDSPDGAPY